MSTVWCACALFVCVSKSRCVFMGIGAGGQGCALNSGWHACCECTCTCKMRVTVSLNVVKGLRNFVRGVIGRIIVERRGEEVVEEGISAQ